MTARLLLPGPFAARIALWLVLFVVFPLPGLAARHSLRVEVFAGVDFATTACSRRTESRHLSHSYLAERVLARLAASEKAEIDPWLRDDLRIAWITTLYAARGNPLPHVEASYRVLGCHPDQVWPRIVARRVAQCGSLYPQIWGGLSPLRKPCVSTARPGSGSGSTNGVRPGKAHAA